MTKRVMLIGGGTGGHIIPLRPLVDELLAQGAEVCLVTGRSPLEAEIIAQDFSDIPVFALPTAKLHAHRTIKNLWVPFLVLRAVWAAWLCARRWRPDVLFCKGGFVCFPFWLLKKLKISRKPLWVHESDVSVSRFSARLAAVATGVFRTFDQENPMPLFFLPEAPPAHLSFPKPLLLVFGGSQGSLFLNNLLLQNIENVMRKYHVVLICGPGKKPDRVPPGVEIYEYVSGEKLWQYISSAAVIFTRASANAICQVLVAKVPTVLVPLPTAARDHQTQNAQWAFEQNLCYFVPENDKVITDMITLIDQCANDKNLQKSLQNIDMKSKAKEIALKVLSG